MTTSQRKILTLAHPPKAQDAIALLRADHKLVSGLFDTYEKTNTKVLKKKLVSQICMELTVHAQVEEEIFYPAIKQALKEHAPQDPSHKDHALVPEAMVEHDTLKALIAQVEGVEPDGEMFDAKIRVLSEYVHHHVTEEQNEMFVKAKASALDMVALGAKIAARKQALTAK
ncbi:MAG TPA: hemerythrin domain-containing protein [Methylophilus sp.]